MELPEQLSDLGKAFAAYLTTADIDVVVIRTADFHQRARLNTAAQIRYRAEGVLMYEASGKVAVVTSLSGREVGTTLGVRKAEAVQRGADLVGNELKEEAAAALAGEQLGDA